MKKVHVILFFLILFLAKNPLTYLGFDYKQIQSLLMGVSLICIFNNKSEILSNKVYAILLSFCVAFAVVKLNISHYAGVRNNVLQVLGAPIFLCAFPMVKYWVFDGNYNEYSRTKKLMSYLLIFFCIECGLAIFERVIGTQIFGFREDFIMDLTTKGEDRFRSSSLMGHPLYNALVVSTTMAFVLLSPLKPRIKFSLWAMGFVAILCFNTRSSIVGNALLLAGYVMYTLFADKYTSQSTKSKIFLWTVIAALIGYYLLYSSGWGARLVNMGLFDEDSAQTRLDVWSLFDYVTLGDLMFGMSNEDFMMLMFNAGLYASENFFINQLFMLGIVFYIPYLVMYFFLVKYLLRDYGTFHKFFVAGAFLLIASVNNSLSSNFHALFLFLIQCVLFNPIYVKDLLPSKYIDDSK